MAIQLLPVILTAIRAGVPAAKLISKYGKKAYKAAKKKWNTYKKSEDAIVTTLLGGSLGLGVVAQELGKVAKKSREKKETIRSSKDKKFKGHSSYKE